MLSPRIKSKDNINKRRRSLNVAGSRRGQTQKEQGSHVTCMALALYPTSLISQVIAVNTHPTERIQDASVLCKNSTHTWNNTQNIHLFMHAVYVHAAQRVIRTVPFLYFLVATMHLRTKWWVRPWVPKHECMKRIFCKKGTFQNTYLPLGRHFATNPLQNALRASLCQQ